MLSIDEIKRHVELTSKTREAVIRTETFLRIHGKEHPTVLVQAVDVLALTHSLWLWRRQQRALSVVPRRHAYGDEMVRALPWIVFYGGLAYVNPLMACASVAGAILGAAWAFWRYPQPARTETVEQQWDREIAHYCDGLQRLLELLRPGEVDVALATEQCKQLLK